MSGLSGSRAAACMLAFIAGAMATAAANGADFVLQHCEQTVHPIPLSQMKSSADPVGVSEDIGNVTVMELAGDYSRGLDPPRQAVAARFFANHPDQYDFLVVFSTFEFDTGDALAFYNGIRNDTVGIGRSTFDNSSAFGSAGKLQGYVDMAAMDRYSFAVGSPDYHTSIDTLAHEIMHRWGVTVHFVDAGGHDSADLLGKDSVHWSYFLDTDASLMYGSDWQTQPNGTFRSVDVRHRYSPLDLYLAGFSAASEVPPFTLIRNGNGGVATDLPKLGASSAGVAETIGIDQVIAASGARVPSAADSQRNFTAAMILLKRPGENLPVERLLSLERFRARFEQQMIQLTDGRATLRLFTQTRASNAEPPPILHGSGETQNPTGVAGAVAWLEQHQASDGHWHDRPATALRDTVAAVRALEELDPGYATLPLARAWIAAHSAANQDQRSWRLLATHSEEDAAALATTQEAAGGFAIKPGWVASAIDTAIVADSLSGTSIGSSRLDAALQFIGTQQNADGSFGVASRGRGQALPTLRVATLLASRTDSASLATLQRAAGWINGRQMADNGIGSGAQSSLGETIEAYSLLGRVPLSPQLRAGIRSYVRQNQQMDGDWGGSVYLTAVAMLAYGHNERPNLAFAGMPGIVPAQPHDGERAALNAVVVNTGNVPIGPTILRWYSGDPLQGGAQIGLDVSVPDLAANSRATTTSYWDTSGLAGEHAVWAVLDAASAVEEASELDNRAQIPVTISPPSTLPDLVLVGADFLLDPSAISTLPSVVHLTGQVRNIGNASVSNAKIRLYAKPDLANALAEVSVDVAGRAVAPVALEFNATAASTLNLLVRADPDGAVSEGNEANNDAEFVLPFGQSLDLEVTEADVSLLTVPALVGRAVEFDVALRNRGTVNSPQVPFHATVVQGAASTTVFDGTVQIPAGQTLHRHLSWQPSSPGPAQLQIVLDPANQVPEANEGNNDAQLSFPVQALDQPDLTFVGQSLEFVPTPGLQGQPLHASIGVRNLSSVASDSFVVALYAADPQGGAAPVGSTVVPSLAGSGVATATILVPDLGLVGDQRLFVKIDATDAISEIDESNNIAIQTLRVTPMPDVAISVADIVLSPPLPVRGNSVEARVTVRNLGGQAAYDVAVRLIEGDLGIGTPVGTQQTIPTMAPGASVTLTWNWTLGLMEGSRSVTAIADPDAGVREGSEDNNVASLPFDVQDGDFFASERYISPNGDGVQDAAVVVFRVPSQGAAEMDVVNGSQYAVRHYRGVPLNADFRGQVVWDGRDDHGRVVPDGDYHFVVVDVGNAAHDGPHVAVDNNLSSFLQAADTRHGIYAELPSGMFDTRIPPVSSPARDQVFGLWGANNDTRGIYRTDTMYPSPVPVVSGLWLDAFGEANSTQVGLGRFEFSTDGTELAAVLGGYDSQWHPKVWVVRTPVDRMDAPTVIATFEGTSSFPVLGYFDSTTIVVGPTADGMLHTIDLTNNAVAPLRVLDGSGTFLVVPSGVLRVDPNGPLEFYPRDAAKPVLHLRPEEGELEVYEAQLSPRATVVAVHKRAPELETLEIIDLASGSRRTLASAVPGTAHSELSGTARVGFLGAGWLADPDRLLVRDASKGRLDLYSTDGAHLWGSDFPPLHRIGSYVLNDPPPAAPGDPANIFPMITYGAEECGPSNEPAGSQRRFYDPTVNGLFVGFGEDVAHDKFNEGWSLVFEPGIRQYSSIDVDTGAMDPRAQGTVLPLQEATDQASYPLMQACRELPSPDWPSLVLRDGARIRADGRVQTPGRGVLPKAWPEQEGSIERIWPDDSRALMTGNRVFSTLQNLPAVLRARTLGRGIELSGVAADLNFASYRLDWAPIENPGAMQPLTIAANDEVLMDEFLTWVPPQPGTFVIRLTVADKAGNTTATTATASSFDSSAIDNFSLAPRYFSPNGDGIQDLAIAKFRVRSPVTLAMRIADANGTPVRSLDQTFGAADIGVHEFDWDGRNDAGEIVADGRYRLDIDGFAAWMTVDTEAPEVGGDVPPAYVRKRVCNRSTDFRCPLRVEVASTVRHAVRDANAVQVRLESAPLMVDDWREVRTWGDDSSGNSLDTSDQANWQLEDLTVSGYAARRYRVVASDVAGNIRTMSLGNAEEVLALVRVDAPARTLEPPTVGLPFYYQEPPFGQTPDTTDWQPVSVEREAADDFLEAANVSAGLVRVAVETADAGAADQWVERGNYPLADQPCLESTCLRTEPDWLKVPLELEQLSPGSLAFVRLRGERADGTRVYSNQGYIRTGGIDRPVCEQFAGTTTDAHAREYYFGPLRAASLHYVRADGSESSVPAVRFDEDYAYFQIHEPQAVHNAWVSGTDASGYEHHSQPADLACETSRDVWKTAVSVAPVVRDQCDGQPSNQIGLGFTLAALGPQASSVPGEPQPHHLSFGYVDGTTGVRVVLFEADDPVELAENFTISTEHWPEGAHSASLDLVYANGETFSRPLSLPVTHEPPQVDIESPRDGERVCAAPAPVPGDADRQTMPASVDLRSTLPSSYRLALGLGTAPSLFNCLKASGEAYSTPPVGPCPDYATLSGFGLTDIAGGADTLAGHLASYRGVATLQIKGLGWSGGTVCKQRTFVLDADVELGERQPPQSVLPGVPASPPVVGIAPAGNPTYARGRFYLRADEPAQVDATLHRAHLDASTNQLQLESTPLASLLHSPSASGDVDVEWNGRVDGQPVADDLYGVAIDAVDDCGHSRRIVYGALVDATPPVAEFAAPAPGSTIPASVVAITGSVRDLHVASWQLDFATADSPNVWQRIESGAGPLEFGLLANWQRGSLTGSVDLRLTAIDAMGNHSEAHLPLVLGDPPTLVGGVEMQPILFSPNADGVLDTTRVQLSLLHDAIVDMHVVNSSGTTIATLYSGFQAAGSSGFIWNGAAAPGPAVPDGIYQVRIHAQDPSGLALPEDLAVSAVVDTIRPTVQTRPDEPYAPADSVVGLHMEDVHFTGYQARLARIDGGAIVASSEGSLAGDVVLASLHGLPEGRYALHVSARDGAGNTTTRDTEFDLDATLPVVTLDEPADGVLIAAGNAASVKGSIEDAHLATWTLSVAPEQGDTWTELKTGNANLAPGEILAWTPNLPDGRYRLRLGATDLAGNAGEAIRTIEVDAMAPVADITSPGDGGFMRATTDIMGRATDAHFAGYRLSVVAAAQAGNGQWADVYAGTTPVDGGKLATLDLGLPQDDYLLRLVVTDRAGLSSSKQVHVRIDSQAPPVPIGLSGQVNNHRDAALSWTPVSASDLAGYVVYRGEERITPTPVTSSQYVDHDAPEGTWPYRVRAADLAGNESAPSNTVALLIDHTPPLVQIARPATGERVRGTYEVVGTAFSSDDFKQYRLSAQAMNPPGDPLALASGTLAMQGRTLAAWNTNTYAGEPSVRLHLEAEDTNGNVGQVDVDVVVDNTPPAKPTGLVAALAGADAQVHWNANTEADLLGYLLYRDNELVNATSPHLPADLRPFALTDVQYVDALVHDGQHTYVLYAIDSAGNVSPASDPASLDPLDNSPPSMTIESPANDTRFESSITVLATSRDTDIAEVRFTYRALGASAWTDFGPALTSAPYRVTWTPGPGIAYGNYEIRALARDAGGRYDPVPPSVRVVHADLTPPDAPASVAAHADGDTVHVSWSASHAADVAGYRVRQADWEVAAVPAGTTTFDDVGVSDGHRVYTVRAFDAYGNESVPSGEAPAEVFGIDLEQPYSPTPDPTIALAGQSSRAGSISLHVESDAGQDDIAAGATAAAGDFALPAQPLAVGGNHLVVRVTDAGGNVSRPAEIWVDRGIVPSAPSGLAAAVADHQVELTWNANSEPDVIGYRVFRNGEVLAPDRLLGELPVASSDNGANPGFAVDGDPQTWWEGDAYDGNGESVDDPSLELAWTEPRIVSALDLTWQPSGSTAGQIDVAAWSGHAWIKVARVPEAAGASQAIALEPYRTTRVRLVVHAAEQGGGSYQVFRLAELKVQERPLQGATSLAETLLDGAWHYRVSAVSAHAFESPLSDEAVAAVGDAQGPEAVVLDGDVSGVDANLHWSQSASADVARYELERDGQVIASVDAALPRTYLDAALPNGMHGYVVRAYDTFGNQGAPSNTLELTIVGAAPGVPQGLSVSAPNAGGLDIAWQPGVGAPTVRYVLRRALSAAGPFESIAQPAAVSYHDAATNAGTTYYYTVEGVDALGNASGQSAPASGTPQGDHTAPPPPILTYPTTVRDPWSSPDTMTDVCGVAEAGSTVRLVRGGEDGASALAPATYASRTLPLSGGGAVPAPDGRLLATVDPGSGAIRVSSTEDSITWISSPESVRLYNWAAHGDVVYYITDGSDALFRWAPGHAPMAVVQPIASVTAFAANPRETMFAMGGSYAIDGVTPVGGVWLVDRTGGTPRRLGEIAPDLLQQVPSWSPDGRHLLLLDSTGVAHLVDSSSATVTLSLPVDSQAQVTWSPDGSQFAYLAANAQNGDDVHVFDLAHQGDTVLASYPHYLDAIAWSPAGATIAVLDDDAFDILDSRSGTSVLATAYPNAGSNGSPWRSLAWTASGRIVAGNASALFLLDPPGWFCASMPLVAGANLVSARSIDAAGNHGFASVPIEINVPAANLPDLAVSSADIFIVPPGGTVGQSYSAFVTLRNIGAIAVEHPQLLATLVAPDGSRRALVSSTPGPLPAGGAQSINYPIGSPATAGSYRLETVADPLRQILESDEGNNTASATFAVSADGSPLLELNLSGSVFAPGESVAGELTVTNPGMPFDGRVRLDVQDANGTLVASLGDIVLPTLGFGQHWSAPVAWDASGIFAGDYRLRARLFSTGGAELSGRAVAFTLQSVRHIQLGLATDAPTQVIGTDVLAHSTLEFSDGNALLDDAVLRLAVFNAGGAELWHSEQVLGTLLPGYELARDDAWHTAGNTEGVYTLRLTLLSASYTALAETTVALTNAAPTIALTGDLTFDPGTTLVAGQAVTLRWSVANSGAVALAGVQVRTRLVAAPGQTPAGQVDETFDLGVAQNHAGVMQLSAPPLAMVAHNAVLEARVAGDPPGQWRALARRGFSVVDAMPPEIEVLSPAADATMPAIVPFRASVLDRHSAVVAVDVSVDGGTWQPVSAGPDGIHARGLSGLIDGSHELRARARDSWGNAAQTAPRPFVVDATPPSITIEGVGDGDIVTHAVTVLVSITDAHLHDSGIELDNAPFTSGSNVDTDGVHVLVAHASDAAGNNRVRVVRFTIDRVAPPITIVAPSNGTVVSASAVRVDVHTEPAAFVVLSTGGYQAQSIADAGGDVAFDAVPLLVGANHVEAVANDGAGNTSLPATVDVTYEPVVIAPLSGTAQPATGKLAQGASLGVHLDVRNPNAAALLGQQLRVEVLDVTAFVLSSQTITHDFTAQEDFLADVAFDSTNWPLGSVTIALDLAQGSGWVRLDSQQVAIVDLTAPALALTEPVEHAVLRSPVTLRGVASDALSGIVAVEARIDGAGWITLLPNAAAGDYESDLLSVADGDHEVELQAHDGAGNVAMDGPIHFAIDTLPPFINIAGVAEGDLLAHAVSPAIEVADAHLFTSDVRLNGVPYVSGTPIGESGNYVIDAIATDLAGNQASTSVHFTLDLDAPVLAFLSPDPGAVVTVAVVDVSGQTEAHASVHLGTGAFAVDVEADADGRFEVGDVPLQAGANTILAHASDRAGNIGADAQLDVVYQPPLAAVSGQIGSLASPLSQGEPIEVPYAMTNTGGLALTSLPLRFELRVAGGGDVLVSDEFTVDLPLAASLDGRRALPTSALAAGDYVLSLLADLPGDAQSWVALDTESFALVPAHCRRGDAIFLDGFDGLDVFRDGLIFCDGFEVAPSRPVVLAGQAPWLDTTAWLAAAGARPGRVEGIVRTPNVVQARRELRLPSRNARALSADFARRRGFDAIVRNRRRPALPLAFVMVGDDRDDNRKEWY